MKHYKYINHPWWEDAKQEAYLLMLEKGIKFSDTDQEEKWINVTATNLLKNIIRKNSHCTIFSSLYTINDENYIIDQQLFKQNNYSIIEDTISIKMMLKILTDSEILLLRLHFQGYKFEEIAQIFSINHITARKRHERIKTKIKNSFSNF